ncbi:MAG: MATE family efflux transporter, partial [Leptospiraceae bacterium]|nr:MATE family efflux transporter [Leptospiraceae bacterium]
VAMVFSDRYFLSKIGKEDLAATFTGGILTFLITNLMYGILGQIIPICSQYIGAGEKENSIKILHQGLILTLFLSPLFFTLSYFFSPYLFEFFNHEKNLLEKELIYYQILSITVFTVPFRLILSNFFIAIEKSFYVTIAAFFGVLINIPLSYGLIFGKFNLPRLGIQGAAFGTLVSGIIPVLILAIIFFNKFYRDNYYTNLKFQFNFHLLKKLIRYGLPSGIEMFVNVSGFLFFSMTMYSYSGDVAAATTIVLNWDMVCFIPLMGISQAVGGLVGKYLGERKKDIALKISWTAIKLGWIYGGLITIIYLSFTSNLIEIFLTNEDKINPEGVYYYGKNLLLISCLYFIFDATYSILGGILKGSGDTLWTMIYSNSCMWSCAILTYFSKNKFEYTPFVSWSILTFMVFFLGSSFMIRFLRKKWMDRLMIG